MGKWYYQIAIAVVGAAIWITVSQRGDIEKTLTEIAQGTLDGIIGNELEISNVVFPITQALPFMPKASIVIGLGAEYTGYFSVKRKDGRGLFRGCESTVFHYLARNLPGNIISMEIIAEDVPNLLSCEV